jgi:hypothetical protein
MENRCHGENFVYRMKTDELNLYAMYWDEEERKTETETIFGFQNFTL